MEKAVLFLDIDSFFAAVEIARNPVLKGKPLIIGGMPDERGVVCTASYEARLFGVHSGMALRIAARKCPQAVFLRGDYQLYQKYSEQFFKCLERFSPRVARASIDEAYLDLSGLGYIWPSLVDLGRMVKLSVEKELKITVTAALAADAVTAKIAAELAKPAGFFWVVERNSFLNSLPIELLPGFGPQNAAVFRALGVRRVADLEKRFPALFYESTQLGRHIFEAAEIKSCSRETTFPYDLSLPDQLLAHLAYLLQRLAATLSRKKLYTRRLEVKVRFADFSTCSMRQPLPFATNSYLVFWKVARQLFFDLLSRKNLPLRLVGVRAEELCVRRSQLLPFISRREEQLQEALLKVQEKFGLLAITPARTLFLEQFYPKDRQGLILKTAALTK